MLHREQRILQTTEPYEVGFADSISAKADGRFDLSVGACGWPSLLCRACFGDDHHVIMITVYESTPKESIAEFAELPYLQGLIFRGDINAFERDLSQLKHLRYLGLQGTNATDQTVAAISSMKGLRRLRLGHNHVTDACIDDLSELTNLDNLGIQNTRISKEGLEKLRQALPHCELNH
ncbi:MAG: hypothetical protein U0795_02780 [Pirellulales bacterium]